MIEWIKGHDSGLPSQVEEAANLNGRMVENVPCPEVPVHMSLEYLAKTTVGDPPQPLSDDTVGELLDWVFRAEGFRGYLDAQDHKSIAQIISKFPVGQKKKCTQAEADALFARVWSGGNPWAGEGQAITVADPTWTPEIPEAQKLFGRLVTFSDVGIARQSSKCPSCGRWRLTQDLGADAYCRWCRQAGGEA